MMDPSTLAVIASAFFFGGVVKGTVGLGLPVVVIAALAAVMDLTAILPLLIAPTIVLNIWQGLGGPWLVPLLRRLWAFLLAGALMIWFGIGILATAEGQTMKGVLGVLLCAYSAHAVFAPRLPAPGRHEVWLSPVMGGAGGLMFGMAGIFIVPAILYLESLRLPRDQLVQALGITFVVVSTAMTGALAGRNLVGLDQAAVSTLALLPAMAGLWSGRRLRRLTNEAAFRKLFFVALFAAGAYMMVQAVAAGGAL